MADVDSLLFIVAGVALSGKTTIARALSFPESEDVLSTLPSHRHLRHDVKPWRNPSMFSQSWRDWTILERAGFMLNIAMNRITTAHPFTTINFLESDVGKVQPVKIFWCGVVSSDKAEDNFRLAYSKTSNMWLQRVKASLSNCHMLTVLPNDHNERVAIIRNFIGDQRFIKGVTLIN